MRPSRLLLATFWATFWLLASIASAAAQNPFVGTWRLNQEKSQMTGDLLKFNPAQGDATEMVAGGITYSFRIDGKTYGTPSGNVAIWREAGPNSWTTEYRNINGKLLNTDTWKLSDDGQTLSLTTSGVKASGELFTDTTNYTRTGGDSGLLGAWKSTEVKLSSPSDFIIQANGLDGLILKIPALKATCEVVFGGRPAAVEGPDIPTGLRVALTRTGPYSFRLEQTLNGSPIDSAEYTVSKDSKTLTEVGGAPGDPPATLVWEKQAPAPPPSPADRPTPSPVLPSPNVH